MKVVETEECPEVPVYKLRLGQRVIHSESLSTLVVLSSVIVQVYEIHVGIPDIWTAHFVSGFMFFHYLLTHQYKLTNCT